MTRNLLTLGLKSKIRSILPGFVTTVYRRVTYFRQVAKLLRRVQQSASLRIIIGASGTSQPHWISTEESYLNLLNVDNWDRFFKKRKIDSLLAEHVWEHLSIDEGLIAARTCYTYLNQGGRLRIAVPDGFCPDNRYRNLVTPPSLGHKVLFNYRTLAHLFEEAGFKVRLLEYYDEKGRFHYNHWTADEGLILRSLRFDPQNRANFTVISSVIIDAVK